jgi:hypothetical protein
MGNAGPGPRAGVPLSDEEALQIVAILPDVLDGHHVRSAPPGHCSAIASAPRPAWPA